MKELSIEEKAKLYDEALERAKKWYYAPNINKIPTYGSRIIEEIFPELVEPEDEKIRKSLINVFATHKDYEMFFGVSVEDIRAWLEKQKGEQKQDPCENCKDICLNCQNFPCIEKKEFKQGKSALEAIKEEKVDNANKVEPKFKVGDWVVDEEDNYVYQVIRVVSNLSNGLFAYDLTDSGYFYSTKTNCHLWTIADAKDGDVLAEDSCIFIIKEMNPNRTAKVYCCLFDDGESNLTSSTLGFDVDSTHPATKEQQDTFFAKIREAGYEWDAEKKELKKIENETEIPFGAKDSELHEVSYYIPEGYYAEIDDNGVIIKKGKKPSAWSKKDKEMSRFIGNAITADESSIYLKDKGIEVIDAHVWLDELKDRVQPQPKQEWSKDDERMYRGLYNLIYFTPYCDSRKELSDWLKSIKQRIIK